MVHSGTFEVERGVVLAERIEDVLRLLHLDLLERGVDPSEIGEWLWAAHWFPHLRHRPEVAALAEGMPPAWRTGTMCDPQILLQFPHTGPEPEITYHVDAEPAWAAGRRYMRIVGVPLSPWRSDNGGLIIQTDGEPQSVELDPGDAVMMTPELLHSAGINRTGRIRYGVYLRWLAA